MSTKHFKTCNKIICIDFDKATASYIRRNIHDGLEIIHVFIRDVDGIDISELLKISEYCINNKIVLVLRCFSEKVRYNLRRLLRGVPKGKYFRVASKCKNVFLISYSNGSFLKIAWGDWTPMASDSLIVSRINYL